MTWPTAEGVFELGDMALHKGGVLPDAKLVWKTHGTLNAARDNVVLYPDQLRGAAPGPRMADRAGRHPRPDPLVHRHPQHVHQRAVLLARRTARPGRRCVTSWDNVAAQRRLLREVFGVERLHCVYGWSMGAQQAYHWAAAYPAEVARAVVLCGSARTAVHNQVFLRTQIAILEAAPEYDGTALFSAQPSPRAARLRPQLCRLGAEPGFLPREICT